MHQSLGFTLPLHLLFPFSEYNLNTCIHCAYRQKDFGLIVGFDKDDSYKVNFSYIFHRLILLMHLLNLICTVVIFDFPVTGLSLFQILKEGPKGNEVLNVGVHEIKNGPFEGKFTAFDQHKKAISVNDSVRVLEGPSKVRSSCYTVAGKLILLLINVCTDFNLGILIHPLAG